MSDLRLIVNADDLGRTCGINEGILDAHRNGILTSATLMVNCAAAADAASRSQQAPGLGVGLHLVLAGGAPVLPPSEVPSLVDDQGRFPSRPERLSGAESGEILAEARAQLALFRELTGRDPTHFDSHYHSHRLAPVCDALIQLALDCDLPVRCASLEVRARLIDAGVATTDAFVDSFYDHGATLAGMLEILRRVEPGTTEVMCHPGQADEALHRDSGYVEAREREVAILTDPRVRAEIDRRRIELVTFEACADRGS